MTANTLSLSFDALSFHDLLTLTESFGGICNAVTTDAALGFTHQIYSALCAELARREPQTAQDALVKMLAVIQPDGSDHIEGSDTLLREARNEMEAA